MQKRKEKHWIMAFLIWLVGGAFGFHRLYVQDYKGFTGMVMLNVASLFTMLFIIGFLGYALLLVWWALDFFLLGRMVKNYNTGVEEEYKNFWEMIKNR